MTNDFPKLKNQHLWLSETKETFFMTGSTERGQLVSVRFAWSDEYSGWIRTDYFKKDTQEDLERHEHVLGSMWGFERVAIVKRVGYKK